MIDRISEAVRTLAPLGTPAVNLSSQEPGWADMISGSWTCWAKKGASTNRPHMP